MNKKIFLVVIFIFLNIISFGEDAFSQISYFNKKVNIGLTSMAKKSIYLKAIGGDLFVDLGSYEFVLYQDESINITSNNQGKIIIKSNMTESVSVVKKDITALIGISIDGKNYRTYRGDMTFFNINQTVLPINTLFLEEYLYSVVPSEIGAFFADEAIKAQIVAARSYTYANLKENCNLKYELEDGTDSQMYLGYQRENSKINKFVNDTAGEVACFDNVPITAYYHSTSGGKTANIEDVWGGNPIPYLKSIDDTGNGDESPRASWTYRISKSELSKIFGFKVLDIQIDEIKDERVKMISVLGKNSIQITSNELRKRIGYNKIFSTKFELFKDGNDFIFKGSGSGHGVGLSQWGANGLALKGKNYKEILSFYYTGITIINLEKKEKYDIINR